MFPTFPKLSPNLFSTIVPPMPVTKIFYMDFKYKRSYWYKFFIGQCPACGKDMSHKERQYVSPKPKDRQDRVVYLNSHQAYCGCLGYNA